MKISHSFSKLTICKLRGGIIVILPYEHVIEQNNGLFYIGKDTENGIRWGIMNNLDIVVEPIYEAIGPCSNGMIAIKFNDKWGYINKQGKIVIEPIYSVAGVFINNIAKVAFFLGKEFYIDKNGNEIIPPKDEV